MDVVGYILIVGVVLLLFGYFKWSQKEVSAKESAAAQEVTVVVEGAYNPNIIRVKKGKKVKIIFDRKEDSACSKKVIFADFGITKELTDFGKAIVEFTPDKTGEFSFSCEMGMYQGKLVVEE